MSHPLYDVTEFEAMSVHTRLRIVFDDDTEQVIDLEPVLYGEMYAPLRDATSLPSSAIRSRG